MDVDEISARVELFGAQKLNSYSNTYVFQNSIVNTNIIYIVYVNIGTHIEDGKSNLIGQSDT